MAIAATALAGCNETSIGIPSRSEADDLQDSRLDMVETTSLENKRDLILLKKTGALSSTDSGYTTIPFDLGVLTFQIEDVSANGSGTDLAIKVGNPTTATITRLTIDAEWYSKDDGGSYKSHGTADNLQISGTFRPGQWTNTKISLSNIKPDKFDYVFISDITAQSITLGYQ